MQHIEKVGVLMVHGIGQQVRYQHLEPEVAELARALTEKAAHEGWHEPVIRARSRAPELRGGMQSAWGDGRHSPIVLELKTKDKLLELHFHEVWWADLGDRMNPITLARFYGWALGMWLRPALNRAYLAGQRRMRFPEPPEGPPSLYQRLKYRAYLALVGLVVFMSVPLSLFARLLRSFSPAMPATVLAEYLGDVKLYQDERRVGTTRIEDLGLPPRASIRARMINALVEMALAGYDRWYVCAHSLGSVIALNGLMETEQA